MEWWPKACASKLAAHEILRRPLPACTRHRVAFARPSVTDQPQAISKPPAPFLAALGLSAGFMAFVAWDQSHWWSRKEDYSFGWLVPLFTTYVVYDRWPQLLGRLQAAENGPVSARWVRWTLNTAAGLGLFGGALFFLLGAFYRAGAGMSQPGTFALTLGMVAIVLPLIYFNVPDGGPASPRAVGGTSDPALQNAGPRGRGPSNGFSA